MSAQVMDMPQRGISEIAGPLVSVAAAVWPFVRRVYGERRAGQAPFASGDLLDRSLDDGLAHVSQGGVVDEAWWRGILDKLVHPFVAPDFLRIPSVQEWLAQPQVRADVKAIARAKIMGDASDDAAIRTRLADAYATATGEAPQLANWPIDVVVAMVAASHLMRLKAAGAGPERGAQEEALRRFTSELLA
jgi:hypothetical protein